MHIELVDLLRCPSPHEETWLVAAVTRFDGRDIVEGALGCPTCHRQFPVRLGEVDFAGAGGAGGAAVPDEGANAGTGVAEGGRGPVSPAPGAPLDDATSSRDGGRPADADEILRARALLGLGEGGGTILVGGALARHAEPLADAVAVMTLLLNPPAGGSSAGAASAGAASAGVASASVAPAGRPPSAIRAAGGVPLAAASLRGAWLDEATASGALLDGVVRALRPGGRLVAPAGVAVPAGIRELARDGREWVGERDAAVIGASAPVTLRRR